MTEYEEAVSVSLLICRTMSDIDGKTKKVSKLEKQIKEKLADRYKTNETYLANGRFGMPIIKHKISQEFLDIQDKVSDAWVKTRKEHIPKDNTMFVSMSELVMQLLNSLNRNKYQYEFMTEKRVNDCINSFYSHVSRKETTDEHIDNARRLAFAFRDNMGIKPNPLLKRLRMNIENNMIIEGKI